MNPRFAAILTVLLCADLCAADRPLTLAEKIEMARNMADEAAAGKAESGRVVTGDFDFQAEFRRYRAAHPAPESPRLPEDADITSPSKTPPNARDETSKTAYALSSENNKSQTDGTPPAFPTKSAENPSPPKPEYAVDSSNFVRGHYMGTVGAKKDEIAEIRESHKKLDKLDSENKDRIFTYSNSMFEIASDDYAAHAMMIAVADELANAFSEYFSDGKMTFGRKILIQAVSKDAEKAAKPFAFSVDSVGNATVTVAWRRDLSLESFCRFMSAATLRKMLREIKPSSEGGAPLWVELAVAQAFEQAVRLGAAAQAARIASENPPESAAAIFAYSPADNVPDGVKEANSYWMLVSIAKASADRTELASFMRASLLQNSTENDLSRLKTLNRSGKDFDLWWRCLITGEIWARIGGVLTPERSDAEIVRLAVLQVDSADDRRVGLVDADIWKNRKYITKDLELRVLETKVTLAKINPLYYNSLVSLGEMFEAARDGEENGFNSARARFIAEFKTARTLAGQTRKILSENDNSKELGRTK